MLGVLDLFNDPTQQPCLGVPLHEDFLAAFGPPALLTVPLSEDRAFDWSSNSNHGALNGGITTTPGGWGVFGSSWSYPSSTGNFWNFGSPAGLTNLATWTASILVRPASITSNAINYVFCKYPGWAIGIVGSIGPPGVIIAFDGTHQVNGSTALVINKDTLITVVYNGSTAALYYNDEPDNTPATFAPPSDSGNSLHIGNRADVPSLDYEGLILFAGLWKTSFAGAQVSSLYNCLLTGEPFPLFQPQTAAMMFGSAAAPAGGKVPWPLFMGRAA